ncbi:MAG: 2-succinyl-5-enolpyruvyl-6-hydroxy-3-cyclohexene-1-carboxylic-acid synthase [Candidatus Dormibacteria bacterium]
MPEPPGDGDVALACMTLLVDELVRGGVEHLVVSPGSRSAPLVLAAARHGGLQLHVHLDERSAAYVALGIGRVTGGPAAVTGTSGTAVANWLPAVVEADAARVPLLLLSADRPPELHHTGANQAIDQAAIFGDRVRLLVDAPVPAAHGGAARYWRSLGSRALAASRHEPAGPVHLNLPFREPLLPGTGAEVDLGAGAAGRADGGPWEVVTAAGTAPTHAAVERLAQLVGATPRGVILAGATRRPLPPAVAQLAAAAGWPLLADPLSGLRTPGAALAAGIALLGDAAFLDAHPPDVVLQVGSAPISRAALGLAARAPALVVVDPDRLTPDPARNAGWTIQADAGALAGAVAAHLGAAGDRGWLDAWCAADDAVRAAIDAALDATATPSEPRTARDVAAALPDGATLFCASSMPIRDLDTFMTPRTGLRVLANRGASGIDGTISTAVGVATATGQRTWALLGDLALLHDTSALLWNAARDLPLTLVVVDNGGGGIFAMLPQARLDPTERALFESPHAVDVAALTRAAGVPTLELSSAAGLPAGVLDTSSSGLRAVIVHTGRDANADLHRRLSEAVRTALA